jgi:GIY-YIG catalytic domain/NUMOD3 motif
MNSLYRLVFPNGKSYIGYTSKTPEFRLRQHLAEANGGSGFAVHAALRKYPVSQEVLYCSDDLDFIRDIMEPYFIQLYKSHTSQHGYNMTDGGDGCRGMSVESRLKISAARTGTIQSEKSNRKRSQRLIGKPKSQAHRDKHTGENNFFFGKAHTEKTKAIIGAKNKGRVQSPEERKKRGAAQLKRWRKL